MKKNLIASAGSQADLEKMINEYFYSENYCIIDGKVFNKKKDRFLDGFKCFLSRGRWRFERV